MNIFFIFLAILFLSTENNHVFCFDFPGYPSFPDSSDNSLIKKGNSSINLNALQVTYDTQNTQDYPMTNLSGRIMYREKFKLSNKGKVADFNSTFVINIRPSNGTTGGEGLAFILAKDLEIPDNSHGQWLGIVNASTNGLKQNSIVAIEFDTKKSFLEDFDGNHVGLNINSVYSNKSASLNSSNILIASGDDITGMILYNGSTYMMDVYVVEGNTTGRKLPNPIISMYINLTEFLPNDVYIGFSASTGLGTELNCVKTWFFNSSVVEEPVPKKAIADGPLASGPITPGPGGEGKRTLTLRDKIMVYVSSITVFVLIVSLAGVFWYRRRKLKLDDQSDDGNTITGIETGLGPKKIKLKDIKLGTGNFNVKNKLGSGGFGIVYLGILDGIEVAVKRINNSPAGKQNLIAEVTTIGSVHHKNVVKLIGWCHENNELILVYEYMPNRSLDYYIHTDSENQHRNNKTKLLSWETRHNIVCGVAQALDYLHNECSRRVLHRDIKASNIMLDSEFNACLGDFGLARMFSLSEKTHHSTKEIAGTPGYMAPEIFHTGRATSETDVFAFGVLALVVACGKKAVFETKTSEYRNSIVDWVWELYNLDTVLDAMDAKLEGKFEKVQAECMLVLGLACCHPNPSMRPSMRNALQVLMGESLPPLVPCDKPVFSWPATPPPSFSCEDSPSGGILTPFSTVGGR